MRRLVIGIALVVLFRLSPAVESSTPPTIRAAATATHAVVKVEDDDKAVSHSATLTADARLAFIRRARVWTKTDTPSKNLRTGPGGPGAFEPNEMVTCGQFWLNAFGVDRLHQWSNRGQAVWTDIETTVIAANTGGGPLPNPQGIALSPRPRARRWRRR